MVRKPSAGIVAARLRRAASSSMAFLQRGSLSAATIRETYTEASLFPALSLAASSAEKP